LSALDATLKVPALPLDRECPYCPARAHPSDLVRNMEQCMYHKQACWESFRPVPVVDAKCIDRVSLRFSETKGRNALLIFYHLSINSQLNFFDFLCTDLKLKTEVKDSN
jgi:hypothetical protein